VARTGHFVFYTKETMKRALLVRYQPGKKKDGSDKHERAIRHLGGVVVKNLQVMKAVNAEIVVSNRIDVEHMGIFYNSVHLSNWEANQKGVDADGKKPKKTLDSIIISHEKDFHIHPSFNFYQACTEATLCARNLSMQRANVATTAWMEEQFIKVASAEESKHFVKEIRVLRAAQLKEQGMNLLYAVGQGAVEEPRCVMVHYKGRPDSDEVDVAFIGKGLCYDSGGLNLKMQMIEMMYGDKNGACAVIGALHGCLKLKPQKNIIFAAGFADNAIGSKAYKPGDIITSMKGLTVEIGNTDAEGRLVLADTFTYV